MGTELASVLSVIRQKRARLDALKAEMASIAAELVQIEAALKGQDAARSATPVGLTVDRPNSRHGFVGGKRARPIRKNSSVDRTLAVLRAHKRPMSVEDILSILNAEPNMPPVIKTTLVSNLSRYVQHKDTFTRPEPGVYGLVEFDESNDSPETRRGILLD